jgi:S1-C subfamily serine protease
MDARVTKSNFRRNFVVLLGAMLVAGLAGAVVEHSLSHSASLVSVGAPTSPPIGQFVSPPSRVMWTRTETMVDRQPPLVVIDSEAPSSTVFGPLNRLQVIAWDGYARRWTKVFDSDTASEYDSSTFPATILDAPDQLSQLNPSNDGGVANPFSQGVLSFSVTPLVDQAAGEDLIVTADLEAGDSDPTAIVVLHDDGQFVNIAWNYNSHQAASARAIGSPGKQRLALAAPWQTPDDAACCAERTFHAAVSGYPNYKVTADDRPWLGAWVAPISQIIANSASQPLTPIGNLSKYPADADLVVSVASPSPAAGVLRPDDVIVGFQGVPPGDRGNDPVYDEFAHLKAGDSATIEIIRNGRRKNVTVHVGSRSNPGANDQVDAPSPGVLDLSVAPTASGNPKVVSLSRSSPARMAGVVPGDRIVSLCGYPIQSPAALEYAEMMCNADNASSLRILDNSGALHELHLLLDSNSASGQWLQSVDLEWL